jgi:hypothetical protein
MNMMDGVSGIIAGTAATALAVVTLDGASISIELAGGLLVSVGGIVWWLSSKFTKLDDNQSRISERLDAVAERLERIEVTLRKCPAAKVTDCS